MAVDDNEKLKRFAHEVISEANTEKSRINKETEKERQTKLEAGTRKINDEAETYYIEKLKELRRENSRELARHTMQLRVELLRRREEILQKVSHDVNSRLAAFTQSDKYGDYLCGLCMSVMQKQPAHFILYLSEKDMKYKEQIRQAVESRPEFIGRIKDILPDKTVKIGGISFSSEESGIVINETLDSNLTRQRDEFIKLIGPVASEEGYSEI